MNQRKRFPFVLFVALLAICLTACSTGVNYGDAGAPSEGGALTLIGSTSLNKVANALAEGFQAQNAGIKAVVGGNGSSEGVKSVNDGTAQIGLLSRNLKEEEAPDSFDINIIAMDGIALITHSENRIASLTAQQIADIYTGKITNWSQVGGGDEKIVVIGREAASGTRSAFEELLRMEGEAMHENEYNDTGIVKQNVARNPGAIGYVSMSALDDTVYAIPVEGVAPSESALVDGSYPLSRPFLMISKKGSAEETVTAFYEYVRSDAGQELIRKAGVLPVQ